MVTNSIASEVISIAVDKSFELMVEPRLIDASVVGRIVQGLESYLATIVVVRFKFASGAVVDFVSSRRVIVDKGQITSVDTKASFIVEVGKKEVSTEGNFRMEMKVAVANLVINYLGIVD